MKNELSPEQLEKLKNSHIRSFSTRRGRITKAQQKALSDYYSSYVIPYDSSQKFSAKEVFQNDHPLVLEIGCGMGETTVAIAQALPSVNFLGCEVYGAGVGALCIRVHDLDLKNVRVIQHDAVEVIRDMIIDESLDGIHIFFPDPWRKTRHHKRRLISDSFMKLIVPKMKPGAYFHCATDWQNYAEQMLDVLQRTEGLTNLYEGFAPTPKNPLIARPTTKYNERGNRLGHGVWDLIFIKDDPTT